MISFIHSITGQIVELAEDLRDWFLGTIPDSGQWTQIGAANGTVNPAPVDAPADTGAGDSDQTPPVVSPPVADGPVDIAEPATAPTNDQSESTDTDKLHGMTYGDHNAIP